MKRTMWINRRGLLRAFFEGGLQIEAETKDTGLWLRWEFRRYQQSEVGKALTSGNSTASTDKRKGP